MPTLYNKKLGRDEFVPNELIAAARDSGDYEIPADAEASFTTPAGRLVQGTLSDVEQAANTVPFAPAEEAQLQEREQQAHLEQEYGDSGARAFGTGVLEGVTLGGFGAALRAIDPEAAKVEGQVEAINPGWSTAGQIVGSVAPSALSLGAGAAGAAARLTPAGAAAALGTRIAARGGGGVLSTAAGLGVEGAIVGAGQGVHQLALEQDPLTFEHAAGTIGMNTLLGAGIGAGAGIVGKVAEKGLLRAKRAVDEGSARMAAQTGVADDLSGMDSKALKAARDVELARIDAEEIAPQRAALADEIATYRKDSKQEKWWLATKGDKDFAELNKVALKADKRLDSLTDDLKGLRNDPQWALRPLRQQEQRLQELVDRADEVRAKVTAKYAAEAEAAGVKAAPVAEPPAQPAVTPRPAMPGDDGYKTVEETRGATRVDTDTFHVPDATNQAQRFALSHYHGLSGYGDLNKALRSGEALPAGQPHRIYGFTAPEQVDLLDGLIAQAHTKRPVTVYRGLRSHPEEFTPGAVLSEPAYMSTSTVRDIAEPHATPFGPEDAGRTALIKFDVPADMQALYVPNVSKAAGEAEVLFPRGTRFRVKSVTAGEDYKIVHAEVLPPAGAAPPSPAATTGKKKLAAIETGATRLAALDSAERLLQRNRALQGRISELTKPPASPRLTAIEDAQTLLSSSPKRSLLEEAAVPFGVSAAVGLAPGGPLAAVAAVMAPKAIRKIGDWVFGRMGRAGVASSERAAKAVSALLDTSAKVARKAPPLSTRVLSKVAFGPEPRKPVAVPRGTPALLAAYQARERELMEQVTQGPDGKPVMRPEARERVYDQLSGVRAVSPQLADRMETFVATAIEYLASKLPKRPDMGHMQIGPDTWHPTDLAMRSFARIVSAVTDPGGVEERTAQGMVTPDEAEAYRTLFPERLADFTRQVIEALPTLKKSLPWDRKLSLTVLTGVPMDPSLLPQVLRVMQGTYAEEPGTSGGMEAPRAQPQFGSMSREQPTPSQQRQEGTA